MSLSFFNINNNISESLILTTNSSSADSFTTTVSVVSSKDIRWNFGDGIAEATNNASHVYSDGGTEKDVIMSVDRLKNVFQIIGNSCNIIGDVDLSKFTECTTFNFSSNPSLTAVTFPTNISSINSINFGFCNIYGEIDLTIMPNFGGSISFTNNPNLTGLTIPTSNTEIFTQFIFDSCNLHGRVDLSGYTNLGGTVNLSYNSNLTGVTIPTSSQSISYFSLNAISHQGALDISGLSNLGGIIQMGSITGITSVSFPNSSSNISLFGVDNNDLITEYNISGLTGLGGIVTMQYHASLSSVTFPQSSNLITLMAMSDNPSLLSLDLSPLSGISGFLNFSTCGLDTVALPNVVGGSITQLYFDTCNFSSYVNLTPITGTSHNNIELRLNGNSIPTADINHILYDVDNFGWTGGTLSLQGGTNGTPDGTSGGYDGTGATASLLVKGWTVNTN